MPCSSTVGSPTVGSSTVGSPTVGSPVVATASAGTISAWGCRSVVFGSEGAFGKPWASGAATSPGGVVNSSSTGPPLAGAVRLLVEAGLLRTGSQNGSGSGVSSEVGCGVQAAAAKRLKKAWLEAAPDGS